jgi:hypothetical protein
MKKTIAALFNNPLKSSFPTAFDSDGARCRLKNLEPLLLLNPGTLFLSPKIRYDSNCGNSAFGFYSPYLNGVERLLALII